MAATAADLQRNSETLTTTEYTTEYLSGTFQWVFTKSLSISSVQFLFKFDYLEVDFLMKITFRDRLTDLYESVSQEKYHLSNNENSR